MANEGKREWFIKLVDSRTKKFVNDDTGVFAVYTAGSPVLLQINNVAGADVKQAVTDLADDHRTVTMTDGTLRFWTDRTVSAVDISVLTAGGRAYWLDGNTQSQHRIDVDPHQQNYVLVVGLNDRASATNIRKLGFQLKKGMVVNDVFVNVVGAFTGVSATDNIWNIGRSGQVDGFMNGLAMKTTGLKIPALASTTGLVVAVEVRGTELVQYSTGGAAATQQGWITRVPYVAVTAVASNNLVARRTSTAVLVGTISAASNTAGKAYIYYSYTLLPMP